MNLLTGHQPNYLPYPGFFSKIVRADRFVIVDHVQFRKKSHHMRNTIDGPNGSFNLSLQTIAPYQSRICDVELSSPRRTLQKHWKSIESSYSKYPYFHISNGLKIILGGSHRNLADLNSMIIFWMLSVLEIERDIARSSRMNIDPKLKNNDMIIEMCRMMGCKGYVSGMGAVDYIDESKFSNEGMRHVFDDYAPIEYPTPKGQCEPNMSVIDAIFSIGPKKTLELLSEHHVRDFD